MSSFFTSPASQRKRKRPGTESRPRPASAQKQNRDNDEGSISGSDLSGDESADPRSKPDDFGTDVSDEDEEEEFPDEDPAAKRVRLAEQYLANTRREVLEDEGFDAADVDAENLHRRMGERLKEDTAESKGKLYRWMAEELDYSGAKSRTLRFHHVKKSYNGVAAQGDYIYAVSKDMYLVKWALSASPEMRPGTNGRVHGMKPRLVASSRGDRRDRNADKHHGPILCVAASQDGKFVATGGADKKLIIWDASSLKPLKVFTQHRDSVISLAFRRGTNQLFSASKDRTIKIWSLNELAYVETLFGHQDEVIDVSALSDETCVTVGARDRTARFWKVVEESQLVFRGGGAPAKSKAVREMQASYAENSEVQKMDDDCFNEGSIDRVVMIDNETFATASDNGSLSLWNIHKKKSIYTVPLAHGVDPPIPVDEASAELYPEETPEGKDRGGKQPRWITALTTIPFSDFLLSGSWDGWIRAWQISQDKKSIRPLGALGTADFLNSSAINLNSTTMNPSSSPINGVVNDLSVIGREERGKDGILVVAAVGKQHRLGRWKEVVGGKNHVYLVEASKTTLSSNEGASETVKIDKTS